MIQTEKNLSKSESKGFKGGHAVKAAATSTVTAKGANIPTLPSYWKLYILDLEVTCLWEA